MTGKDAYTEWDAAYVLGALDSAQRLEYEEHLVRCPECQAAVAELAGLPGLLAQLPPGEVLAMDHPGLEELPAPPASLMPELPDSEVNGAPRSRRRWLVPLSAAAAALVIGAVGGYAMSATQEPSPSPTSTVTATARPTAGPARLAFTPLEPASMTAVVDVIPEGSRTLLRVECQYAVGTAEPGKPDYEGAWAEYSVWVVGRSGQSSEVKRWTARPDRVMHPSGISALPVGQIAAVEIRRVDTGDTVMRAMLT